jgi:2'-5' RNA ligase
MTTKSTLRLFLAMEFSEDNKLLMVEILKKLKQQFSNKNIRWINQNQLHLTLHFLGDVSQEKIPLLKQHLSNETKNHPTFELQCNKLIFIPVHHPHVISLSIQLNNALADLFKDLKQEIQALNIQLEDRPYLPHITLGRIKEKLSDWQLSSDNLPFFQKVNEVVLFQSELTEAGSVYTALARMQLHSTAESGNCFLI